MSENIGWISLAGSGSRTEKMVLVDSTVLALLKYHVAGESTNRNWECFVSVRTENEIETVKATKALEWLLQDVARLEVEIPTAGPDWVESEPFTRWQKCLSLHQKMLSGLISEKRYEQCYTETVPKNAMYPGDFSKYYPGSWGHHTAVNRERHTGYRESLIDSLKADRFWSLSGARGLIHQWAGHQDKENRVLRIYDRLPGFPEPHSAWSGEQVNENTFKRIERLYEVLRLGYLSIQVANRFSELFSDAARDLLIERSRSEGEKYINWARSHWSKEAKGAKFPELG
ncbi:MAG: hypothetical protein WD970_02005 [Patescibacteria group bacterium]